MLRPVCASCHGVAFSLASLADPQMVRRNFRSAPAAPPAAMEMVRQHGREKETP